MARAVVLIRGGLGNQLFCYAAARSVSEKPLVFGYGGYFDESHPTLADLGIAVTYPNRLHRSSWPGIAVRESWRDDVSSGIARVVASVTDTTLIRQQTDPFAQRTRVRARTVVLDGWFQHPDWWRDSWAVVADEIAACAPRGVGEFRATNPVVIKLRRSDYLPNGWALDVNWLRHAMKALDIATCDVVLTSEDPDALAFAAPVLAEFGCRVTAAPTFTGNANIDDFWAIAAAHRLVLANSSYCWWAGAVGHRLGGPQVAYPQPWLPNAWGVGQLPNMGLPGWIPISADF